MRFSIVFLVSLSFACSKKEQGPPANTELPVQAEASGETGAAATAEPSEVEAAAAESGLPPELQGETPKLGAPPTINVLEPGNEPRKALRWTLTPGAKQKAAIDLGFDLQGVVAILKVADPNYVVSVNLTLQAKEVDADGALLVVCEVNDASFNPAMVGEKRAAQIQKALVSIRKLTGRYRMHPRGHIADVEFDLPSEATRRAHDIADNLGLALLQMTPVFPDEPLGDGAKWTVHRSVLQGGIQVNQLSTIELLTAKGAQVELQTALVQTAEGQPFMNPGLPREMTLLKLDGTGSGHVTWELSQLMPNSVEAAAEVLKVVRQWSTDAIRRKADSVLQVKRTVTMGLKPDDAR